MLYLYRRPRHSTIEREQHPMIPFIIIVQFLRSDVAAAMCVPATFNLLGKTLPPIIYIVQ